MRYPACLVFVIVLSAASVHAADAPPAVMASPAAPSAPVPVTSEIDLFNGKNLTNWIIVTTPATDISKVCQVKDGVMVCTGKPVGYLEIPGARENYKLHFEWRWTTTNAKNNSGALLNISSGPVQQNTWPLCFQIQTKTTRAGDVIPMGGAKCAELLPTPATTVDRKADSSEKPSGQWNACDVIVRGDTIECSVNGVTQNKVTKCTPSSGRIGFQLEGYPYEMRSIRLTPLETAKPAASPAG